MGNLLLSRQINSTFDAMLLNAAERVERRVYPSMASCASTLHYFSISTARRGEGKIFYRIRDAQGKMLAGFRRLEGPPTPVEELVFYDTRYAGNALRAVAITFCSALDPAQHHRGDRRGIDRNASGSDQRLLLTLSAWWWPEDLIAK
ncbi:hypothetical protein DSL92_06670 [Billgrantia gudaonensis]|uniref:Two-component sensor kinase N-terminal domain-containing protein n=1 Tax=Billgrantia gudaonensis TaxID=376427 RepID=A0A3S0Q107_9GAMM|nr:hypothetical protein DSL92_06670 [Halomonas gudaonensis]